MDLLFINPNQVSHLGSTVLDTKRCATEACTTPTAASSLAAGAMVKRHSHSTVTSDDDHHSSEIHHAQHDDAASSSPAASVDHEDEILSSCFFDKDVSEAASVANFFSKMEQELADELVTKTVQRVDNSISKSNFLQQNLTKMQRVPIFTFADESSETLSSNTALVRGDLLGTGGFAHVYDVTIRDTDSAVYQKKQYVVKQLAPTLLEHNCVTVKGAAKKNNKKLFLGAKDIVLESYMLAALDHPHILKLEGISLGGIDRFGSTTRTDAYFMVLPKLTSTLSSKISKWKRQAPPSSSAAQYNPECIRHSMSSSTTTTSMTTSSNHSASDHPASSATFMGSSSNWMMRKMDRRRRKREAKEAQQHSEDLFFCERLQIIIDLLKALEHLHEHRIMHRDIKPPNIGFDQDGCLKLFDFGLAKELPTNAPVYSGECKKNKLNVAAATAPNGKRGDATTTNNANLYLQLGNTGTPRYMAPEIIRREPYHCKVDVYAASIVAWEVMTLKKPYGQDVTGQFVKECVAIYGDRPTPIPRKWPKSLKKCIQQGWTRNTDARPSSNEMRMTLQSILEQQQHKMGLSIDV